jgi:hypothetical protein
MLFQKQSLPPELAKKFNNAPHDNVNIIHSVYPSTEYGNNKYVSCYVHEDSGFLLSEKGFKEFPYAVPRYLKSSNETYGRSPAMNALPDVKMLN